MKRVRMEPRRDWQRKVEEAGLLFHHIGEDLYWDESACYEFEADEIDELDAAVEEIHELSLACVQHIIDHGRYEELSIPVRAIPYIEDSWKRREPSLYGRLDLAYNGSSPPKLLEYNADTPTSLLEASVVQWFWVQDRFPDADQFNSIHEKLADGWQRFSHIRDTGERLLFACVSDSMEDLVTVTYLQDTADGQGFRTDRIFMEDIGWDFAGRRFTDLDDVPVLNLFKLYPWEWILDERFGPYVLETYESMCWVEPIWKMLLSNKGILPILWELDPGHPNLLEAHFDGPGNMGDHVKKPKLSREGANVSVVRNGRETRTDGLYGKEGHICQALADIPCFDGNHPVLGCWIVDGRSAGMGIRESTGPVTFQHDRFVPHLFR